jgi:hypothetical protein
MRHHATMEMQQEARYRNAGELGSTRNAHGTEGAYAQQETPEATYGQQDRDTAIDTQARRKESAVRASGRNSAMCSQAGE